MKKTGKKTAKTKTKKSETADNPPAVSPTDNLTYAERARRRVQNSRQAAMKKVIV